MKKSRIIRALKNYDSEIFKTQKVFRFEDEKGKIYFLGEEKMYMTIITDAINTTLHKVFEIIDDEKLKEKIIKEIKNVKK
tara:strand:+ start:448 stop:687 length:240 start_codon:yes stop_codon:yes gene_type:complete